MKKKILILIEHLIDGIFIGTAITYALLGQSKLAIFYLIAGLVFIAFDIIIMIYEGKNNPTKGELDMSTQELRQIFKDKLANAEDSYQHFTMVDKDAVLAYYAQEDIKVYKAVLALIDRLEKEGATNV